MLYMLTPVPAQPLPEEWDNTDPSTEEVWARIRVLRTYLENGTLSDHQSDIFDAAYELSQLIKCVDPTTKEA